jgi:hypothetical protein
VSKAIRALVSAIVVLFVAVQPALGATPFRTFVTHENSALKTIDGVWAEIHADVDSSLVDELEVDAGKGERRAIAELEWLGAHPPTSCYRPVHTKMRGYWQLSRDALRELRKFAHTRDQSHLDNANAALGELNSKVDYYNRVIRRTRC